jgi:dienelactone hydrolase
MGTLTIALLAQAALTAEGDLAMQMVDGIHRFLDRETATAAGKRGAVDRERLRKILGVVDERVPVTMAIEGRVMPHVSAVRWSVLPGVDAEGLLFEPTGKPVARVVALPDADQAPEAMQAAWSLAANGCQVLVPVLIDTSSRWSGYGGKMTKQPHREWIYRMAFEVGRHVIGYEIQKTLAAVDWFTQQNEKQRIPIGVVGYGEGGLIARYSAAIDPRIQHVFAETAPAVWTDPIYRDVWGLLREFGDAPMASDFLKPKLQSAAAIPKLEMDPLPRLKRQFDQLVEYTQKLVRESPKRRAEFWGKGDSQRQYIWDEVIGRLPNPSMPANPRTRQIFDEPKYTGYEVMLDVWPDVFAYGILLVPKGIKPGERRPVVVCQHGLEGRPRDVADPKIDSPYYHRYAVRLAEEGFVTFSPQNPYIGEDRFRTIQRKAHPLKLSLFAFIIGQHQRIVDWLGEQPYVDPKRIGFYGLSYGGKTAMRVPPFVNGYALSICSADFNEWVWKTTNIEAPHSYMLTREYDMYEFDFANVVNYAELAMLIAPRPFMVERGHNDGVGLDEWVAFEYAKVRRHYAVKLGLPGNTEIEFFNGPHTINGQGTFQFLRRHLRWPE